ncbi:MAG: queuosine precursor transporter [bacterium]
MEQLAPRDQKKVFVCLVLYITALIASNTLGIKTMPFLFGTHLSVSVFYFPFVFLMTDIIGEVYGKTLARQFVFAGFFAVLSFMVFNIISMLMPWSVSSMWAHDAYNTLYSVSIRISIASVLAFAIGEYQDVLAFFFFKARQGSKYFWLRSNLSNIWSQLFDTVIFTTVAFAGIYSNHRLILMIIPWWIYKVLMGFAYTPLSYLGIKLLRSNGTETKTTA